ncbi:MAG: hypothetical protein IPN74_05550 [Haliscomenobacter sp.]|nr:hypothetical protein [Haliscomenobacter sp.]MBK8878017.1 hypothetical protein [Haliscomenobacter sp.]
MKKQDVVSFFREIVIVIIGILIALSIDNWNENRNNEKYIDKALFAIEEEIKLNKTDMHRIVQRHKETIDAVAMHLNNDKISLRQIIENSRGFQIAELKNIGLRFFISNKAELIDYEIISSLSEIEFLSEAVKMKTERLLNYLYDNMENTNEPAKNKFVIYLADVVESENGLLGLYDDFLNKQKKPANRQVQNGK